MDDVSQDLNSIVITHVFKVDVIHLKHNKQLMLLLVQSIVVQYYNTTVLQYYIIAASD